MRRLLLAVSAVLAGVAPSVAAGAAPMPRIIGGEPAVAANWGFAVALTTDYGSQFCAGSLVQPRWVLTAGHCRIYSASAMRVVVGQSDLRVPSAASEVVRMIRHPDYRMAVPGAPRNDLMLLKLRDPVSAPLARLATRRPGTGQIARVAGWGATSYNRNDDSFGPSSPVLRTTTVRVRSAGTCVADYGAGVFIPEDMVCASLPRQDACAGDSGGPLVQGAGAEERLVGVVSWGTGCALPSYPGVYALVTSHRCWIDGTTLPPRAVDHLVAAPGDGVIDAEWTWTPPCATSPEPEGFRVRVLETGQTIDVAADRRRATVPGLVNGQAYTISVVALNGNGEGAAATAVGTPAPMPIAVERAAWTGLGTAELTAGVEPLAEALRVRTVAVVDAGPLYGPWTDVAPDAAPRTLRFSVRDLPVEPLRLRLEVDRLGVAVPTRGVALERPVEPALIGKVRVTGTAAVGRRVACEIGRWTGTRPLDVARIWLRDGRIIRGATERTLSLSAADAGSDLRCRVTVTGPGGTTRATSAPIEVAG